MERGEINVRQLLQMISVCENFPYVGDADYLEINLKECGDSTTYVETIERFLKVHEMENPDGYVNVNNNKVELAYYIEEYICKDPSYIMDRIIAASEYHINSLSTFEELNVPVIKFSLEIGGEMLNIYPVHFSFLIAEISLLNEPFIIKESMNDSIKIDLPDNISNNLTLDAAKLLFKFIYSARLPSQVDLIELPNLRIQLKSMVLLCDYLGIKYYPQFFKELDEYLEKKL